MQGSAVQDQEHIAICATVDASNMQLRPAEANAGAEASSLKLESPYCVCREQLRQTGKAGSRTWWCLLHLVLMYVEPAQLLQLLRMDGPRSPGAPRQCPQARCPHLEDELELPQ